MPSLVRFKLYVSLWAGFRLDVPRGGNHIATDLGKFKEQYEVQRNPCSKHTLKYQMIIEGAAQTVSHVHKSTKVFVKPCLWSCAANYSCIDSKCAEV